MPDDKSHKGCYSVGCSDVVHLVEFCPFEWASQLVAVATPNRLAVATCKFPEEDACLEDVDYEVVKEFHHDKRITAMAWSPVTSLLSVPSLIRVYAAGTDNKIYVYGSDMDNDSKKELVGEHGDYINAIAVHQDEGKHVASVSDDHTCKVWATQGSTESICFPLTSAGVSVTWHTEHPEKLMVAEQKGVIRFYNFMTQQPIMSLDCGYVPLVSADWCPSNDLHVACVTASDWFVFDTSRSSSPLDSKMIHQAGCSVVRWSRAQRHLMATSGQPDCQLKVTNIHTNQTLVSKSHVISCGLSWHYRLPLVMVGGDNQVHFYRVDSL